MSTSAPADVRILGRVAGAVLLAFGLGLTALMVFLAERQLTLRGHIERGALIFLAVCAVLSLFCFPVGYRLITQRPNKYRSVLPPLAWFIMAVLFAAAASMFFVIGAHSRELTLGGVFSAVFSLMAIVAARRAQRNENQSAL